MTDVLDHMNDGQAYTIDELVKMSKMSSPEIQTQLLQAEAIGTAQRIGITGVDLWAKRIKIDFEAERSKQANKTSV